MNTVLRNALAVAGLTLAGPALAQITFYEHDAFKGQSFTTDRQVGNFKRSGFNDMASSVVVTSGNWEVCVNADFSGQCVVLREGQYSRLRDMGMSDRISSVRSLDRNARYDDSRYAPPPRVAYDYRRRNNERLYEAEVTSVRAVLGPPEQRCWTEREQVSQGQSQGGANIPGAVVGAVIGGILGHQVGSGRGNDAATVGGAVAGGYIGSNVNRGPGQSGYSQDVRRCETVANNARPDHWEVTYNFRGQEHRMQMESPPGQTVTVNRQGEPRA